MMMVCNVHYGCSTAARDHASFLTSLETLAMKTADAYDQVIQKTVAMAADEHTQRTANQFGLAIHLAR